MFLFYGIGGGLFMRVSLTTAVVIALGARRTHFGRLWPTTSLNFQEATRQGRPP
jgi:hypothetical protein